ncbi:MAG: glutamate 5-kinase [Gammaproteobacteria bacterium]|nr:glutamate 5-kinase [Gammaproteobacteria bacterium]MBU1646920.1 glutamate 5-kinase [Gammaproteobacteria bacterium]MBU1972432.1 glutamate 5-kinase [Gammaproteobacteria bacterium]
MRSRIAQSKRLVVKVGSALVTRNGQGLDYDFIGDCARQIAALQLSGRQVLLVSSGAIAAGMQRLGWSARPHAMHDLQAAAAVGQMGLAQAYDSTFASQGLKVAQILLTHDDLSDRTRYLNARSTLHTLVKLGVVPIINENDTVVTDEIKFGDNDTLGALVANLIEADALIILTDQRGLYSADPRLDPNASLIAEGSAGDRSFESIAGGSGSIISKGGMITKVRAARRAARSGAHTVIISGRDKDSLLAATHGENVGTVLYADETPLTARKQWLADHLQLAGRLLLDDGAATALKNGRSLLAVGVRTVDGDFERGAAVQCCAENGSEIARGLINYSSSEARRIAGNSTQKIESLLGYIDGAELIHRDNLVLL